MDKQQKLDYQHKIENYLSEQHVYDLFEDLLKNIVVKQPEDPISYLIEKLSTPETKKIFIIGPPGFKVRQFALQIADHYKFTTISVGDLLRKQVSKKMQLGQQIEGYFKNFSLVSDQIVINLVKKQIEANQKDKKSFILSGFPKTRAQGLAMQRAGIFPDAFIMLNMDQEKLPIFCEQKFKANQKILDKVALNDKNTSINNHCLEYSLNLKQLKQIYANNFFQIDSNSNNRQEILQDMARLLKYKIKSKRPKRPASILILGGTKDQRVQIGKKLSKRYGFVFVTVRDQLADQIGKHTEVGRLALQKMRSKQLIQDSIVNGLIQNRLSQVDCQMQGFVLQGYPKTKGQVVALKDTYIQPNLIVNIEGGNLNQQVSKQVSEKYQSINLKVGSSLNNQQVFQKVCFQLQNN